MCVFTELRLKQKSGTEVQRLKTYKTTPVPFFFLLACGSKGRQIFCYSASENAREPLVSLKSSINKFWFSMRVDHGFNVFFFFSLMSKKKKKIKRSVRKAWLYWSLTKWMTAHLTVWEVRSVLDVGVQQLKQTVGLFRVTRHDPPHTHTYTHWVSHTVSFTVQSSILSLFHKHAASVCLCSSFSCSHSQTLCRGHCHIR